MTEFEEKMIKIMTDISLTLEDTEADLEQISESLKTFNSNFITAQENR